MQSERESINRLCNPRSKVSSHYLINQKGEVFKLVKDLNIAWHAGKSCWGRYKNLNENSIGIELVNKGHAWGYEKFEKKQIFSLIKLSQILVKKYKIKKKYILGHSDIAPLRKIDPGEKFPWKKLSNYNLGKWYRKKHLNEEIGKKKIKYMFFKNLHKLGYRYFSISKRNPKDKKIIKSFQQHYSPKKVTGKIDQKTYKISHFLTH